jgi:PAS domain S-box-containing protein
VGDEVKTKAELLAELEAMRQRLAELERAAEDSLGDWKRASEQEEHYRAAVDNVTDAIVINVGTTRVFVNNAFLSLHGLADMAQADGLALDHFIVPEDKPLVRERTLARERGEPAPGLYRYRIRRPDGEVRTVESSAVAITFDGQPATLAVLRDITEKIV